MVCLLLLVPVLFVYLVLLFKFYCSAERSGVFQMCMHSLILSVLTGGTGLLNGHSSTIVSKSTVNLAVFNLEG